MVLKQNKIRRKRELYFWGWLYMPIVFKALQKKWPFTCFLDTLKPSVGVGVKPWLQCLPFRANICHVTVNTSHHWSTMLISWWWNNQSIWLSHPDTDISCFSGSQQQLFYICVTFCICVFDNCFRKCCENDEAKRIYNNNWQKPSMKKKLTN